MFAYLSSAPFRFSGFIAVDEVRDVQNVSQGFFRVMAVSRVLFYWRRGGYRNVRSCSSLRGKPGSKARHVSGRTRHTVSRDTEWLGWVRRAQGATSRVIFPRGTHVRRPDA